MGFWDKVKKKANDVYSGADWWDNEENAVQRNNAATGRNDVYTPATPMAKPQQSFFDKVRDVTDADSPMDIYKRTQAGAPKIYAMQQKENGIGRVSDNAWERGVNTVKAIGEGIAESPRAYAEYLAYESDDQYKARNAQRNAMTSLQTSMDTARATLADPNADPAKKARVQKWYDQQLEANGDLVKDDEAFWAEQKKMGDPKRALMAGADMAFTVATAGVGGGAGGATKAAYMQGGKEVVKETVKQGGKQVAKEVIEEVAEQSTKQATKAAVKELAVTGSKEIAEQAAKETAEFSVRKGLQAGAKELVKQTALNAAVAAPSGAFGTAVSNPDADAGDIFKGAYTAAAFGAALPIAGMAVSPITKPITRAVTNATIKPIAKVAGKGTVKVIRAIDKQLPGSEARITSRYHQARVDDINALMNQYRKAWDNEASPKRRREIAKGLGDLHQQRKVAISDLEKANKGLIAKPTSRAAEKTARQQIDELSQLTVQHERAIARETNPIRKAQLSYRMGAINGERERLIAQLENPTNMKGQEGFIGGTSSKDIAKYRKKLFETPAGKRFEGSDQALVAKGIKDSGARHTTVGELIDHPEMFKSYPQLKEYTVVMRSMPPNHGGAYSPATKTLYLNRNRPANARLQTLMHELTHAIDDIEGYKAGGGPDDARLTALVRERAKRQGGTRSNAKMNEIRERWRNAVGAMNDLKENGGSQAAVKRAQKQADAIDAEFKKEASKKSMEELRFQAYQDYFGETGARTVSNRLGLTDAQRAKRPFLADLDSEDPSRLITLDENGKIIETDVTPNIPEVAKGAPAPTRGNPAIHPTMAGAKISSPGGGENAPVFNPTRTRTKVITHTAPKQQYAPVEVENAIRTQFGTAFVDKDMALIKVLKRMEKATGKTGLVERFLYDSGLQSRANSIANFKLASSQELQDAMQGLGRHQLKEFNDYANARAELTMAKANMKTSRPQKELQKIVSELEGEYGDRFTKLNAFYKERAKDLLDAGIIDKKKYQAFVSSDDYIRLQRDFDDLVGRTSGTGNSYSFGKSLTSFRRKGSERTLLPADQVTFEYTQQIQKEIQRNQTASNLIDMLSEFGMAKPLSTKQAVNKNYIKRIVNGKTEVYEVDPVLKNVIDNIRPYSLNGLERIIGAPARTFRAGTTALSAPFSYANYLKDQAGSAINSEDVMATHIRHPQNIFTGLWEAGKDFGIGDTNDPMWKKFIAHAGDTTQYDLTRNVRDTRMLSRELRHGQAGRLANATMHPIRTLEDFNAITEKATRFQNFKGMYEKVLAETNDPDMAMQRATVAAWQNSVDFNRAGNIGRFMNLLIPYFNAGIQGTRQMGRSFTRSPGSAVATTAKAIGIVGMPLYAATAWNLQDEDRREMYNNISEFEKENNIIFILPRIPGITEGTKQNEQGAYNVLKIPMPPGFKDLVMPGRRAMESFANKEPAAWGEMANDLMQAVAGPLQVESPSKAGASLIPQAVKPLVQQMANQDFFTGKDIVPDYIEGATDAEGNPIPEEQKAQDWTSGTARIIGEKLNLSPIRVEKFLKDTFGAVGQYSVNTVDNALAMAGKIPDEQIGGKSALSDISRRFTSASGEENFNASEGTKWFNDVDEVLPTKNGNTRNRWEAIHPTAKNFLGESINEKSIVDQGVKAGTYIADPEVFEVDRELDKRQRQRGRPGNPIFDLPPDQLRTLLSLQANKSFNPGDKAMPDVIEKQNPWLKKYFDDSSAYFDTIQALKVKEREAAVASGKKVPAKEDVGDPNGIPRPEVTDEINQMFDVAEQITDPALKSQFYKQNPKLTEYLAQNEQYNRAKRAFLGLPQLDRFPEDPKMKAIEEQYFALDKGARKAFMLNNPGLSDYWLKKNLWQLNEAGARARFEGEELDEDAVKDIMSIARSLGYGGSRGGGGGGSYYGKGDVGDGVAAPNNRKPEVKGVVRIAKSKSTPGKVLVKRGGRI